MTHVQRVTYLTTSDGHVLAVDAETDSNWIGLDVENPILGSSTPVRLSPEDVGWLIVTLGKEITLDEDEAGNAGNYDEVPQDAVQAILEAAIAYAQAYAIGHIQSLYGNQIIDAVQEAGLL